MDEIDKIRTENLTLLIKESGSVAKFARKIEREDSQVWQWVKNAPDSRTGKPRKISGKMCRLIEEILRLPKNWFDESRGVADLKIPRYDVEASMGYGKFVLQENVIENITVSPEWLSRHLKNRINTKGLCIITGSGVSMEPVFSDGDPLIVDTAINAFVGEAIYYFRVNDALYVKWLQQTPAGFKAISQQKAVFDPFLITKSDDFQIIGKVIKAWKSTDF